MDQQQIMVIADRFITELHRIEDGETAGIDRIVDMFADNAKLTNSIMERDGSGRSGRDQIADFWRKYGTTFKNIHSEFFDITASDHSAGLFWRSTGTNAGGEPLEYEGASLLELDDTGKISRFKGFLTADKSPWVLSLSHIKVKICHVCHMFPTLELKGAGSIMLRAAWNLPRFYY